MTYDIVDPERLYGGKSYTTLVEDWLNWYVSADPDKRTFGEVVFLRSTPIPSPNRADGYKELKELSVSNVYANNPLYDKPYSNNPEVRVGGDKLQIRKDQAIFVPIICAFEFAREPFYDWGFMQDTTGSTVDYGDNPPEPIQVLIDGIPIKTDLKNFRIRTPLFPVIIPETDYGRSIKDFMEDSIASGQYLAMVEGYFVLIKNLSAGTHSIYSRASASREKGGTYVAELLYEITVENRPPLVSRGAVPFRPPRNVALIKRILDEKVKKGEITQAEMNKHLQVINPPTRRRGPVVASKRGGAPKPASQASSSP